jgi:hypothetical protein
MSQGIKLRRAVQRPREYIISRAAGYHSGFNAGYNIAEAVNFALPQWLNIVDKAHCCQCSRDSVKIDMKQFRRKLLGLPPLDSDSELSDLDESHDHSVEQPDKVKLNR